MPANNQNRPWRCHCCGVFESRAPHMCRYGLEELRFCAACAGHITYRCESCDLPIYAGAYPIQGEGSPRHPHYVCSACLQSSGFGICDDCGYASQRVNTNSHLCPDCQPLIVEFDGNIRRTATARKFGIELETARCPGYENVSGRRHVMRAKRDGSLPESGREFVTPPLQGDSGLRAVEDWLRTIPAGWEVNRSCGYHLHIEVSDLPVDQLCNVLAAYHMTGEVWRAFMPRRRRTNDYCGREHWDIATLQNVARDVSGGRLNFADWCARQHRYVWLNVNAFARRDTRGRQFGTYENRLHTGTLNRRKIVSWVRANLRFIEWARTLSYGDLRTALDLRADGREYAQTLPELNRAFNVMRGEAWRGTRLGAYYARRAARYGTAFSRN